MAFVIEKHTLLFLTELARNNNREWFALNKSSYLKSQENVMQFLDQLIIKMNRHNVKLGIYRISLWVRIKSGFGRGFEEKTHMRSPSV